MQKEEFEARLGVEVTGSVYDRVEALYMAGPDDKDTFVTKLKRKGTVVAIQNEIIRELEKKIARTETYLTAAKARHSASYERPQAQEAHRRAEEILDSNTYYGNNHYLMGLEGSVTCQYALEYLRGEQL